MLALLLFLSSQNAPPLEAQCQPCASFKDGFIIEDASGNYRLRVRGLLQVRSVVDVAEFDPDTLGATLAIQRAQIEFGGHVFTKELGYQLKTEWGQGFTFIKDAWVSYEVVPSWLEVRAGQWKRPFSRQELTSDSKQAFVERSITNSFFGGSRDVGVAIHNDVEKSRPIEWAFGVFSGATDRPTGTGAATFDLANPKESEVTGVRLSSVRDPMLPTFVARLGVNSGQVKGYNELDTDGGALRYGIGVSVLESVDINNTAEGVTRAEIDAIVKVAHVDLSGAVFVGSRQIDESSLAQEKEAVGYHAQVGVLFFDRFHPGIRYDYIAVAGHDDDRHELTTGFAWLFFGQSAQLHIDGSYLINEEESIRPELRARAQMGFAF